MKWVLCGLTFALAVALAIATAAIRAGNTLVKQGIEEDYKRIDWRWTELQRLRVVAINEVTPERLAAQLRELTDPVPPPAAVSTEEATPWQ